tara:strand:+ start:135 stop:350 length:216 start_codon:yes stop_codon:yes gene_type:complete
MNMKKITVEYLMEMHQELNKKQAISLYNFSINETIKYIECYGDGSIIYPLWKREQYIINSNWYDDPLVNGG